MNRAASHLAATSRSTSRSCIKWKVLIGRTEWDKKIISKIKMVISSKIIYLWGLGNGRGFIMQITSLILIRKFHWLV